MWGLLSWPMSSLPSSCRQSVPPELTLWGHSLLTLLFCSPKSFHSTVKFLSISLVLHVVLSWATSGKHDTLLKESNLRAFDADGTELVQNLDTESLCQFIPLPKSKAVSCAWQSMNKILRRSPLPQPMVRKQWIWLDWCSPPKSNVEWPYQSRTWQISRTLERRLPDLAKS
jgi:hypothetical protein